MADRFRLMLVGAVLLAAGCEVSQEGGGGQDRVAITAEHISHITDVQWTLERMVIDGKAVALTGDRPHVQFASDGRVTGFSSVNRFFGLMQIDPGGQVRWPGALAATRMAGPPALMRQEEAFMAAIQSVRQWSIEGIRLYGQDAEGSTQLVFSVPAP